MRNISQNIILILMLVLTLSSNVVMSAQVPEFTQKSDSQWINSKALNWSELRGKVVLLDFWTFDCWNCYRSFPWLNELEEQFSGQDFAVIGIHSPEFDHEKDIKRVKKKVREFELAHPVMLDNDFAFWRAMNNRYWPAFYLVDKQGKIRGNFVGETHSGTPRAKAISDAINKLLAEDHI